MSLIIMRHFKIYIFFKISYSNDLNIVWLVKFKIVVGNLKYI